MANIRSSWRRRGGLQFDSFVCHPTYALVRCFHHSNDSRFIQGFLRNKEKAHWKKSVMGLINWSINLYDIDLIPHRECLRRTIQYYHRYLRLFSPWRKKRREIWRVNKILCNCLWGNQQSCFFQRYLPCTDVPSYLTESIVTTLLAFHLFQF